MLSPSSPIHAAFFLKPTWYTLCPLPALSSPAFDYNQLLEFLHALHLQGLHAAPIDFNTTLRHCQKHLSLNGNQVRGIFDSLVLLNDQGASQISATTLLILLFGQLSHQSASATGSEEDEDYDALESSYSDSFQDCYVTYAQQATFWKSHFKEFLCALSLLFDGPEAIQKASQVGDKLSLSVSFAKDVIDQLFIGLPTESSSEVVESFESWTEHRETNRTAFSLTASETKPVSEWMTAINKKQKEGSSERVDFAFLQDFVEWGLGVESPMLCSPSFTRHGLSQGLQNDIPGFPVIISAKSQSVVVCRPDQIRHRTVILHGLIGCHVYLLGPVHSLIIQTCSETRVFVGAVSLSSRLSYCQKLNLSGPIKQVWVDSSAECQFNLHNQYKTVVHGSKNIVLAPLNFTYDGLCRDVQDGQIEVSENLFDEFVHWSGPKAESVPHLVGILQPLAFEFQYLPLSTSGSGSASWKLPLPEEYDQSMTDRERITAKLREFLGTKGAAVSGKTQRRLMDWIQESGQMPVLRQYVGLTADVQGISVERLDETCL